MEPEISTLLLVAYLAAFLLLLWAIRRLHAQRLARSREKIELISPSPAAGSSSATSAPKQFSIEIGDVITAYLIFSVLFLG